MLEVSPIQQKEVIFLTDLQAASWRPPAEVSGTIKQVLARLEDRRVRWVVIDVGKAGGENRAVTDLKPGAPFVPVGSSCDRFAPCCAISAARPRTGCGCG